MVASVSVSGPSVRLTPDRTVKIAAMVAGEAHALSIALGFQPLKAMSDTSLKALKEGAA